MRDFLRQSDDEADVSTENRVAQRCFTGLRRVLVPSLQIAWIELPGLPDVVHERPGQNDIATDRHLRKRRFELVDNFHRKVSDTTQVIGLIPALQREHAGISLTRNVSYSLEA